MFGRNPFSDTSFAGVTAGLGDGPVALVGRAVLSAVAITTFDVLLADQPAPMVFAAEIHPWVLAGRA